MLVVEVLEVIQGEMVVEDHLTLKQVQLIQVVVEQRGKVLLKILLQMVDRDQGRLGLLL
jgi:hypothetical protein